ncbi:MAG: PKD domain-containing protein [bacterium]
MKVHSSAIITLIVLTAVSCSDRKEDNPLTANNQPPTLQVLGFASDTLVYVNEKAYEFDFVATDDGQKELEVLAKAIGNSGTVTIVDKTEAGLYKAEFVPSRKGEHLIEISVSDGLETATATLSVFFGDNQLPVAVIQFQELARDNQNLLFTYEFDAGNSKDKDSRIVKATWNLDGVVVETPFEQNLQHTFNYYADYKIDLTVEDEYGGINSTSATIDNSRPLASFIIRPVPEAKNGDQITLDAAASVSPRGQISEYEWLHQRQQGVDILAELSDNLFRYQVNMPVGENFIGLVVMDVEGNVSDTTWVSFNVINQPPQADFGFRTELERIIITDNLSQDTDPGDTLSYSWFLNDSLDSAKQNEALPVFDLRGAVYQLTLTVTDNHGASGSRTRSVSVPGVPEAHFVFPGGVEDNFETGNGESVVIDGSQSVAGNESRGIESFTWFLRGDNFPVETLSDGRADEITLQMSHQIGEYEIGLKITNQEGMESATTWKKLILLNSAPIAEFTCEFQAFLEGIVYRILTNDSTDPDPSDSLSFHWFLDGVEQEQTGPTPTFTRDHSSFVDTITLRVEDLFGGTGEKSITGGCSE